MPLNNPTPGIGSVAEFQVSALPWVTSSSGTGVSRFDFPYVTSFINVKNTSTAGSIEVGFSQNGVLGNNGFALAPGESFAGELRVVSLFVSGSAYNLSVIAGLTRIVASELYLLTGSLGYQGVG